MKKNILNLYEGFFDDLDQLNKNQDDEFGDVNRDIYNKHDYILSQDKNPEFFYDLCDFCKDYYSDLPSDRNGFTQEDLNKIIYLIPKKNNQYDTYFDNVTSLDELQYFHNLNFIYKYTFSCCTKLKSVIFPKNIIEIRPYSFSYCTSLKELIFPKKIKTIYNFSFYDCYSLEKIVIPLRFKNFIEDLFTYVDLTKVNITYI